MHSTPAPEPPMPEGEPALPPDHPMFDDGYAPPAPFPEPAPALPPPEPPRPHDPNFDDGMYSPHLPVDHDRTFDEEELPDPPPEKAADVAARKPVNVAIAVAAVIAVLTVAAWLWLT